MWSAHSPSEETFQPPRVCRPRWKNIKINGWRNKTQTKTKWRKLLGNFRQPGEWYHVIPVGSPHIFACHAVLYLRSSRHPGQIDSTSLKHPKRSGSMKPANLGALTKEFCWKPDHMPIGHPCLLGPSSKPQCWKNTHSNLSITCEQ